jgi:hypothetical protein
VRRRMLHILGRLPATASTLLRDLISPKFDPMRLS